MCTMILAKGLFPGVPLVLGHDRDELVARAWLPPGRWPDRPGLLAPRDLQAGGTWLAVNDDGLVVAVTNRAGTRTAEPLPSRGQLALHAAAAAGVEAARDRVREHLRTARYHGFNLLLADARRAVVLSSERSRLEETELDDGLHVITSVHHVDAPEDDELRPELLAAAAQGRDAYGAALRRVLSDGRPLAHGPAVCKHLGAFGTVCGAILWLGPSGLVRYELAPGPPCTTPFADVPLPGGALAGAER